MINQKRVICQANELLIFTITLIWVIVNIVGNHIVLDTDSKIISLSYYVFKTGDPIELSVALTSVFPLVIAVMILFLKIQRSIYFILGILGLIFTVLLWVLMNLHLDAIIVSYTWIYYSVLGIEILSSIICFFFAFGLRTSKKQ